MGKYLSLEIRIDKKTTKEDYPNYFILRLQRSYKSTFFKNLSILPIDDLDNEATALSAFKFFTKALPATFNHFFKSNYYFHSHNTRSSSKNPQRTGPHKL